MSYALSTHFWVADSVCKVLQTDNEHRLQEMSDELRITRSELEEKRTLCEKLEMDLLQMDQHKPNGIRDSGTATPSDVLSDLDIGGKRSKDVSEIIHIDAV